VLGEPIEEIFHGFGVQQNSSCDLRAPQGFTQYGDGSSPRGYGSTPHGYDGPQKSSQREFGEPPRDVVSDRLDASLSNPARNIATTDPSSLQTPLLKGFLLLTFVSY
jgi:hypothetical protein